ncbi:DUF1553 domain-containing protein [Flexithrix dorotheae]|uniref:DUF1553 domain-containing protein n=1 Tax=Flexithrix dorotheae TaxID=70993 RepID=UPI000369B47F
MKMNDYLLKKYCHHQYSYAFFCFLICATLFFSSCGVELPPEVAKAKSELPETIDFNIHVKPILSDKCFACHGPDKAGVKGGLQLTSGDVAFAELSENPGHFPIVPGKLSKSQVFHRIATDDQELVMPPLESNLTLSDEEKAILIKWIEQGAKYKPHWAFIKPEKHPIPEINQGTVYNSIDNFVLSRLEKEGLTQQSEAEKEILIRRVSLDLTGLPPSLEDIEEFLNNNSPDAYEQMVDKLLASPHYGEKMAVDWMDLSRFADTHGYSVDRYRPMWPWRDWVIKSFNENMPFDQFVEWQLAGDLLPNPTREQILATGFNRNHAQNMEGGIVNEEFRVEYVADRTNTLGTAFLGLTVECARCHDHKYDPISQKEYFQLFGYFNNVDEAGQISWDDAMPVPTILLTDEKQDSIIAFLDGEITKTEKELSKIKAQEKEGFQSKEIQKTTQLNKKPIAHFPLDELKRGNFVSRISNKDSATLVEPVFVEGKFGKGVRLNGDEEMNLRKVGVFNRSQPFTVGLWINIPNSLKEGVIFHKGNGAIIYNFRGYHLAIRDNKFELLMAHTWPYNNIIKLSKDEVPKDKWIQLTVTYDGSSKADGFKLFVDGEELVFEVEKDKLYKDILFPSLKEEPGLQIGARWRGTGIKGAIVDEIKVFDSELTLPEISILAHQENRSQQPDDIYDFYLNNFSIAYRKNLKSLNELRAKKNKLLEDIPEAMVMDELENPRKTFILERGVYDAKSEEVIPGTPENILPFPESLPKNRLGLAKWLMHKDNPLTARVFVNRFWKNYFGRGLVSTTADFGNQGELPSHPELLDWLANQFIESGWDIKAIQKLIVMSATYRQSSFSTPELREIDPDNVLLARGPAFRLSAEMLRDNVLFASGLMNEKQGGPSVKPYQPEGLWKVNGSAYKQDKGDDLYRRSLYTFWKRTVPPPSMNTFDAPSRSYCVVNREKTSTPLQALVLLNDPQFVEASKALATKQMNMEGEIDEKIGRGFRLLTARKPNGKELNALLSLYEKQVEKFNKDSGKMAGWLTAGEMNVASSIGQQEKIELAALAIVNSAIINSDAFITRR